MVQLGALAQAGLLVCATILTFVFFFREHAASEAFSVLTWDVVPRVGLGPRDACAPAHQEGLLAPCEVDGDADVLGRSLCALKGVVAECEVPSARVSVPLMCLAACVVGCAYALAHSMLAPCPRRLALLLLLAYSVLLLCVQQAWLLPISNLVVVLTAVVVAFFHLGTLPQGAKASPEGAHAVQPAVEMPLLGVAVLAATLPSCSFAGLCGAAFGTAAALLLCGALWHEAQGLEDQHAVPLGSWVCVLSVALALSPQAIQSALAMTRLQALSPLAPTWLIACSAVHLFGLLAWTVLFLLSCHRREQPSLATAAGWLLLGLKAAVVLTLLVGMLSISEQ